MKLIGYADHVKVYHINYSIDAWIYFRFCNGKMKKSKIQYDENGNAFFMVENTLRYFFNEITRG